MAEMDYQVGDETMESFDVVPPGEYKAMVVESDVKPTKSGTGTQLVLTWQIVEGEYEGRKIWGRINLRNANEKAVQIGRKELNTLAIATGKPSGYHLSDSTELHDIPVIIDVKIRPAEGQYREGNEIKGYKAVDAVAAPPAAAPKAASIPAKTVAAPPAKAPATAAGKPAWMKK